MKTAKSGGLTWLAVCSAAVILFGAALVLAPRAAAQVFGWMLYGDTNGLLGMGDAAARYILFVHAVLGSVMIGWGVALLLVVRDTRGATHLNALRIVAASIGAWFIPDTTYSLLAGFWQNAVLNMGFALAFGVGFAILRRTRQV